MRLAHVFRPVAGGTRYLTRMRIGAKHGFMAKRLSHVMRRRRFSEKKAQAWLKHNVEEVGNLPHFLPALFAGRSHDKAA